MEIKGQTQRETDRPLTTDLYVSQVSSMSVERERANAPGARCDVSVKNTGKSLLEVTIVMI